MITWFSENKNRLNKRKKRSKFIKLLPKVELSKHTPTKYIRLELNILKDDIKTDLMYQQTLENF